MIKIMKNLKIYAIIKVGDQNWTVAAKCESRKALYKRMMSNLQFQNDLERLIAIMPPKVVSNLSYEKLDDVIEIVLDIGRVPEVRHAGGKIEKLQCDVVNDEDIKFITSHLKNLHTITVQVSQVLCTVSVQ